MIAWLGAKWAKIAAAGAALITLIGGIYLSGRRSGKETIRGKIAQEKLDATDEARRIRHRLRTHPSFAKRMREKFQR